MRNYDVKVPQEGQMTELTAAQYMQNYERWHLLLYRKPDMTEKRELCKVYPAELRYEIVAVHTGDQAPIKWNVYDPFSHKVEDILNIPQYQEKEHAYVVNPEKLEVVILEAVNQGYEVRLVDEEAWIQALTVEFQRRTTY